MERHKDKKSQESLVVVTLVNVISDNYLFRDMLLSFR